MTVAAHPGGSGDIARILDLLGRDRETAGPTDAEWAWDGENIREIRVRFGPLAWLMPAKVRRLVHQEIVPDVPGARVSWDVHWIARLLPAPRAVVRVRLDDPVEDAKRLANLFPLWERALNRP